MELQFLFSSDTPKYAAIYEQLKEKILSQQLQASEKLPSKRKLAEQLNISIQTVQIAYEQLLSEGYIFSVERSGYYIAPYNHDWQTVHVKKKAMKQVIEDKPIFNLKNGQVDAEAFPYKVWQKYYRNRLQTYPIQNSSWQGEQVLRNEIVHYIQQARGIFCEPEQIFIYSGTQQQLQALCTFFGQIEVAMEEPGFHRANAIFQQNQYEIQYVPIDNYGATIPLKRSKLYYVTPAHQFPLGTVMSVERKIQLLEWAEEIDAYIIEDDYDAEFRYKGLPIPPLAQLDQLQRVIYFGTFSKTLMPSIRMSYMILPLPLAEQLQTFYRLQKSVVSRIDQLVVTDFMEAGYYTKHIEKMRTLYRKKRKILIEALQTYLPDEFEIFGDSAGLHVVIQLPEWLHEKRAVQLALEKGVAIDPISACYQTDSPQNLVMIGFGAIEMQNIHTAIQSLSKSWLQ